jgi:hypothetical protein
MKPSCVFFETKLPGYPGLNEWTCGYGNPQDEARTRWIARSWSIPRRVGILDLISARSLGGVDMLRQCAPAPPPIFVSAVGICGQERRARR